MKTTLRNRLRLLAAALTLAAATAGILTTPAIADTTDGTTSVVNDTTPTPAATPTGGTTVTPLDTTWG